MKKQFESINTYNYIITLICRRKNPLSSFLELSYSTFESPLPKGALCQVWLNLAHWFWKRFLNFVSVISGLCNSVVLKKILKFCQCISLFHNYLLLEKGGALHLNKLESPSPTDALCQVWLKLAQFVLEMQIFKFRNEFSLFLYHLALEKVGPFIWTN